MGDLVRVADDLGESMSHFASGCNAIVEYSYLEKYGPGGDNTYSLHIENVGSSAWYYAHQLTFIRHDPELLVEWKKAKEEQKKKHTDIKWIHANWSTIKEKTPTSTMLTCFSFIGFDTSFHRNGEYFVLVDDWRMAFPFINRLMEAKAVDDMKGPDGEVSGLASSLFSKLQQFLK